MNGRPLKRGYYLSRTLRLTRARGTGRGNFTDFPTTEADPYLLISYTDRPVNLGANSKLSGCRGIITATIFSVY